ncbi:hypothetical protein Acy02nite_73350 [Actinoplanes cyaneus]|uniref:Uncharacterized protein n=1 Tax=Actinoplanes cyaneus TaxID=52696 RepID=A0A919MBB3_9ACTN|nr:hypothetical protein [Actinoplanes cyaneus]MCW2135547.1 hypothetical protein [Actinoplanes cyaneus]GID69454.1 hypothetical protein Acy02nite_73350 [Actinoplanes cyaneus]
MTDDDLRATLRRADPAASLPPLPSARVDHLLEQTMATPFADASPATDGRAATPSRWRRPALLAAAAAVVLAGAGIGWLTLRTPYTDSPSTTAGPGSAGPASPSVTRLTGAGIAAKCVEPTAQVLASRADLAVAATVRDIAGDTVTLQVTHVYKGTDADLIEVPQAPGASEGLMGSGSFEAGRKYLVAASEGSILTCGYSGEADAPGLAGLYEAAF